MSKGAVSHALNGHAGVSESTRARILQAAEDLGWKPNLRAKGLSSAKAYALGLVVARDPKLLGTDPFFPAFIAGVESTLVEHDYVLVLASVSGPGKEEESYRKLAAGGRVDGVLLTDVRTQDPRIGLLQQLRLPAVTLNRPEGSSPFPAVCMDDTAGIVAATSHLIALGHQRIAHVGGPQTYIHGRSRRCAWETEMEGAGLKTDLFIEADFTAAAGAAATARLLQQPDRPTAIVFANDVMAIAGLSLAQSMSIRVPDDLSITGYDNTELARFINPPLTTISTDPVRWGRVAAQVLLDLLSGNCIDDINLSEPNLVPGGSTGPVPG